MIGQKGVVYYKLLKPGKNINGIRNRLQLMRSKHALARKKPKTNNKHIKLIFQQNNA